MSIVRQGSTVPLIFCPTVPTVRKAALERLRILPAGAAEGPAVRRAGFAGESGFTLLEVVCVLAIIAMVAAVLLPSIPRGTSRSRLQAYALEIGTLLEADRNAAIRRRTAITTEVDAVSRSIRSGTGTSTIHVPTDVQFDAALASRCNQREAGLSIVFFASGMSCGGVIALTRLGAGYQIRVNWFTGGVEVVPLNAS
jgi:general secretion pathway protein H